MRRTGRLFSTFALVALATSYAFLPCSRAHAEASDDSPYELKHTNVLSLSVESAVDLGLFATLALAPGASPATCRWCGTDSFDVSIRNALRMHNPMPPAMTSHVFSMGIIPVGALAGLIIPALMNDRASYIWQDAWMMVNNVLLTTGIATGVKIIAGRQRPAFHFGVQSLTEDRNSPVDGNASFFSGDTALAFTLASTAATIAYLRGYRSAPYIAIFGGAAALLVGVLRISADMHWATDVITGALVGTAAGIGIPLLLHGRDAARISIRPVAGTMNGAVVSGTL